MLRALLCAVSLLLTACGSCGGDGDGPKKFEPCGDGVLSEQEKCDTAILGSCPTECPSSDPCMPSVLQGTECNAECVVVEASCGVSDQCCPTGCGADDDDDCSGDALCGNGLLEAGETCDPLIPAGSVGACECEQNTAACTQTQQLGSPATCDVQCIDQPITACVTGDGCCPDDCALQGDGDCDAECGNGIVEGAEACDGNCPTFCDDGNACTNDLLVGAASNCTAVCQTTDVTSCTDSDGCCPSNCSPTNDNDCSPVCGNGVIEAGETCDGNCPTQCDDQNACTNDLLVGSPANCDAACTNTAITACVSADGCCPMGCTSTTDSDCVQTCGNGIVEPGESCDGNCPAVCDDGNSCTTNLRTGSDATCDVACSFNPIIACIDNDGCCPNGCDATNDSDCSASCGNNVIEGNERCDGNCPTSCDDFDACTENVLAGSPASCTAECTYPDILTCTNGDGCCPTGCVFANDADCPCFPNTCASLGYECGTIEDDGCGGGGEVCGFCADGRTCVQNFCQLDFDVGDACSSNGDCAGVAGACITELTSGWDGGYCTRSCGSDADCGTPNHCGADGFCWQDCTADSDCRAGYLCFDDDGDGLDECAPAGTGSGAVGDPCTRFADCSGGESGWCATEASQFKDGFCSLDCSTDADCPVGTHCWASQACVPDCSADTDCRGNGYACYDGDGDATVECFRWANGAGAVGDSCAGMWECGGGQWGWCQLPLNGWNGGYCTIFCGAGQDACPSGAACFADAASSYCLDNCQNVNQCRSGYQCTDPGGVGRNVCNP